MLQTNGAPISGRRHQAAGCTQNGPIGKSQSVAPRPHVERLLLWVTSAPQGSATPTVSPYQLATGRETPIERVSLSLGSVSDEAGAGSAEVGQLRPLMYRRRDAYGSSGPE